MSTGTLKIGPADQGRAMTVAEFQASEFEEGFLYELGRGRLIVSDVPNPPHLQKVRYLRNQLALYDVAHPGVIGGLGGGAECRLAISQHDSVRHPDVAVYLTQAPTDDATVWEIWIPELVVEVVSPGSEMRDRQEKRDEYLAFGVREYWIVDAPAGEVLFLQRVGGRWRETSFQPGQTIRSVVLPGFECDCGKLLGA